MNYLALMIISLYIFALKIRLWIIIQSNSHNHLLQLCIHMLLLNKLHHEKTGFFCMRKNKDADQLRSNCDDQLCSNCAADQCLCFCYIAQSLFFLNPKFEPSSHLLWLHSPVCVEPGRKLWRQVFSCHSSNYPSYTLYHQTHCLWDLIDKTHKSRVMRKTNNLHMRKQRRRSASR